MDDPRRTTWKADGLEVPIRIHREWRKNARISIGSQCVHLRIPKMLPKTEQQRLLQWAYQWLKVQYHKNPHLFARFRHQASLENHTIQTPWKRYRIQLYRVSEDLNTIRARLEDASIILSLPEGYTLDHIQRRRQVGKILSKLIAKDLYPNFRARVDHYHKRHFEKPYKEVRLRYTKSIWGSCSTKGSLSFSTRLLLTPLWIMDYVIVHELVHLEHPNHSRAFWKRVETIYPDYQRAVEWLRVDGQYCDF